MKLLGTLFLGIVVLFYSSENSQLEKIKAIGELRVITRHGPTTYYEGPNGKTGLEYELAKRFAQALGVNLQLLVADNFDEIWQQLNTQQVHFAAAGLAISMARKASVRFGPSYQEIAQQLVYRRDHATKKTLADFTAQRPLLVIAESNSVSSLRELTKDYPELRWTELSDIEPTELLEQVWEKEQQYALLDSTEVSQMRRFYPELEVGLELPKQQIAWAFPQTADGDNSLYLAAVEFFRQLEETGELEQLIERYYGHLDKVEDFNHINFRAFHNHIKTHLPKYQEYFQAVASNYELEWQLLAAIGYQESQWEPSAVSVTGVRGLMMLTQTTAQEMGVKNREDPFESIEGGAKYFVWLKKQISKKIPEPDRTWFTLAAYNVGLGHLLDAREITAQLGDNSERWVDVKKHLPKLADSTWYEQTKYGQARGNEPVQFVKNVRRFYEILVRLDSDLPKPSATSLLNTSSLSEQFLSPISTIAKN
jgi:membrane-bound lytic murein transglycosylase F